MVDFGDVVLKSSNIGQFDDNLGVFANRNFKKGEVVITWNLKTLTTEEYNLLSGYEQENFCHTRESIIYYYPDPERHVNRSKTPSAEVMNVMKEIRDQINQDENLKNELGLTSEEIAFFKVVEDYRDRMFDSAFLATLIQEVVTAIKKEFQIDWTKDHRRDVYAKVKNAIKMVLRKRKITGEEFKFLTNTLMEQAEEQYKDWPRNA